MVAFKVVTLALEEPGVLNRFAAHHLAKGANCVEVYYDGEDVPPGFEKLDGLCVIPCDAGFWKSLGVERSHDLILRQRAVFHHAHSQAGTDWMLATDCDEFIAGSMEIGDMLDRVPDDIVAVNVPTAEAVFGPGDDPFTDLGASHFRLPIRRKAVWSVLGRPLRGHRRRAFRKGLLAHSSGKSFVRGGVKGLEIGNHAPRRSGRSVAAPLSAIDGVAGRLRSHHFDAISFTRWREKWRRRVEDETEVSTMASERRMQMAEVAGAMARGEDALLKVFHGYYGVTRGEFALLRTMGYAFRGDVVASLEGGGATRTPHHSRGP